MSRKMNIHHIIFDLGGVLLNIDYQKPVEAFRALGVDLQYSQKEQTKLFDDLETGKISPDIFRDEVRRLSGKNLSDEEIDRAWNSILLDLPEHRVDMLHRLKSKYPLFLLSNTNEIHIAQFEEDLIKEYGHPVFEDVFQTIYYSSRIGKRKPNADAFLHVLQDNEMRPENTLFIDDSPQHVEGAKKLGIQAYLLKGEPEALLQSLGLI